MDAFEITAWFDADPATLYRAWTDPARHAAFTGGAATGKAAPGNAFSAWDGYITGTWVSLQPDVGFTQAWRTDEFAADDPDSQVELSLRPEGPGTELKLRHSNVPVGDGDRYRQGWVDHYFDPLADWLADGQPM